MRGFPALLLLAFLTARAAGAQELVRIPGTLATDDGLLRSYDVYEASDPAAGLRPLLLVFHGGGSGKDTTPAVTCATGDVADARCLNRLAALGPERYVVVYPQGFLGTWNAGNCCGPAMRNGIDDVAFVARLLDRLEADFGVDPARVYATGISNGAMLSHRLACELSDRIAAIAPVAGGIGIPDAECRPERPVPVLEFHGTADQNYPYEGGVGGGISPTDFIGIPETIAGWVGRDGCSGDFDEARLPDAPPEDGTTVFQDTHADCRAGTEIVLDRIEGGGHTWPDGSPALAQAGLGIVSRDVNANQAMLDFFARQAARKRRSPILPGPADRRPRTVDR